MEGKDSQVVAGPAPASEMDADPAALLTALLFTSGERVESKRLSEFLQLSEAQLTNLVEQASAQLRPLGLDVLSAGGGLKLVSAAELDEPLAEFHRQVRKGKLSKSALEILAVVAYDQPVSRAHVDEVRQVNSESTLRALLDRRLIAVASREDSPGRPFLYKTTDYFLEVFGLGSLRDLPPRPNLKAGEGDTEGLGPFEAEDITPSE